MRILKKSIFFVLLFCSQWLMSANMQVVFRYDDYQLKNDSINHTLLELFQKRHLSLVLGLIPRDSMEHLVYDSDFRDMSLLLDGVKNHSIEIALHGYNHTQLANGEFGGVSYAEQSRRMQQGKHDLDSLFNQQTITFIPPYNAYDATTLDVMSRLGFKVISSGIWKGQSTQRSDINYYPYTVDNPDKLLDAIEQNKHRDGIIVLMFHRYDIGEKLTLADLDTLLQRIKYSKVNPVTFRQLYETHQTVSAARFNANLQSNFLSKQLHLNQMIQTTRFELLIRMLNLFLCLCVGLIISFLVMWILKLNRLIPSTIFLLMILILLIIVTVFVWFQVVSPLKLFLLDILIALVIPFFIKFFYHFKNQ